MKEKVHNLIILDESGSMQTIKHPIIKGFNNLVENIKKSKDEFPNQDHFISLISFNNSEIKYRLINQPIAELSEINVNSYVPDGLTPLNDAICKGILKLKHELYYQDNYHVLVTIFTDGYENNSLEFTQSETKLLIETMSAKPNWTFGLIGANIDVAATAESLSIPLKRIIEFTSNESSVTEMFGRYFNAQSRYREIIDNCEDADDLPF